VVDYSPLCSRGCYLYEPLPTFLLFFGHSALDFLLEGDPVDLAAAQHREFIKDEETGRYPFSSKAWSSMESL
jgi:hypothetical protein